MISIVDSVNQLYVLVSKNIMRKTIDEIQTNQSKKLLLSM